jgi:hypothetical protein
MNPYQLIRRITSWPLLLLVVTALLTVGWWTDGTFARGLFFSLLAYVAAASSFRLTVLPLLETVFSASAVEVSKPLALVSSPNGPVAVGESTITATAAVVARPSLAPMGAVAPSVEPVSTVVLAADIPANLPIAQNMQASAASALAEQVADADAALARAIEAAAHKEHVLLSADAVRRFVATVPSTQDPLTIFAEIVKAAKQQFPAEDGWVVISEEKMRQLCVSCVASVMTPAATMPFVPTVVPAGTGSLAEMIAAGNLGAAYELIGHRPMFALADAVADFDALYRSRQGQTVRISTLLKDLTDNLSTETIKAVTVALTSALDGTYTDEAEAVKMAIMKAIKVRG